MAVQVRRKGPEFVDHKDGVDIKVQEGHLIVLRGGTMPTAIYAPGEWVSAEVQRAEQA